MKSEIDKLIDDFFNQDVIFFPQIESFAKKTLKTLKNKIDIIEFTTKLEDIKKHINSAGKLNLEHFHSNKNIHLKHSNPSITQNSVIKTQKNVSSKKPDLSVIKREETKQNKVFRFIDENKNVLSVLPKSIVGKTIYMWFKENISNILEPRIQEIMEEFCVQIKLDEIITLRIFKKYEIQLNNIANKYFIDTKDPSIYKRPTINPFLKHKFQNPTKGKEGNYKKLIFIRPKT